MNYSIGSKNLSTELFILKTLQESKKDVEIRPSIRMGKFRWRNSKRNNYLIMEYVTYKVCINGVYYVYVIPKDLNAVIDLQTGKIIY